ncbi:MAG TPA: glycoside hydrolase family 16 protein [Verrucomicrobiae bacterium]|nr:glycoside hydrolase family 16 protein [Verrucomicrobiae bacterium]
MNPSRSFFSNRPAGALAAFAAISSLCGSAAFAGNILNDPGFEASGNQTSTEVGWTMYGQGFNTLNQTSASIAHSGSNYFKVFQGFTGSVTYSGIFQDNPSGAGATYSADGWAYTSSSDVLSGTNLAWIEVTFRDFNQSILALYRSSIIGTNAIKSGAFHPNTWYDLRITNLCNPSTGQVIGAVTNLTAPPGTTFVRYQVTLQGDPSAAGGTNSGGSMYFDDMTLNQTAAATNGLNIVWSDEFNGSSINRNNWNFDIGNGSGGWGNNELEYYTSNSQNAYVSNGVLHIVALKQSTNGYNYTSARMNTSGLYFKKYGVFEFRAKFPEGQGYWPALWMFPQYSVYGGWAASGEIDVFEANGNNPTNVLGTIHYGGPYPGQAQSGGPSFNFSNGDSITNWHNYSVQWTTNSIAWTVDNQIYETQTSWYSYNGSTNFPYPAPFDQQFFIIMNLAVGGNFPGSPNSSTVFPGDMQVDYVRVYDFTPLLQLTASTTNGHYQLSWPTNIVCRLQSKLNIEGTWNTVIGAASPYTPNIPANGAVFYRLVSP